MQVSTPPHARMDFLDAARAFALLLGIVFHAGLSFVPIFIGWAVMDVSTSPAVSSFTLVSHSFRMPLFFLMAGYFGRMIFHRKGALAFVRTRFQRVALPFALGWFVLYPAIVSGWVVGAQSLTGDVDVLAALRAGLQAFEALPSALWTGTHLWFLYYLLLAQAGVLALRGAADLAGVHSVAGRWADATMSRLIGASWIGWLVLALPVGAALWFMDGWGMDTPDRSLRLHLPALLIYGGFCLFGWLLHRHPEFVHRFAAITPGRLLVAVGCIAVALALTDYQYEIGHPQWSWIRGGFIAAYAVMMWALVAVTLGLAKRMLDRPNAVVRYISDASYWLYLVHLPIVVWLQVVFAEWPLHWSLKLPAISLITIALSLLAYDLLVRDTWIGTTINGRRKPRVLFRRTWSRGRPQAGRVRRPTGASVR